MVYQGPRHDQIVPSGELNRSLNTESHSSAAARTLRPPASPGAITTPPVGMRERAMPNQNDKGRYWVGLIYPGIRCPDNCQEAIKLSGLEIPVSPLHGKDAANEKPESLKSLTVISLPCGGIPPLGKTPRSSSASSVALRPSSDSRAYEEWLVI